MISRLILAAAVCAAMSLSVVATAADEVEEIVKYQLADWKNIHTKDNAHADKLLKTFKTLQVETQVSDHGNHKDVKYRCPKWKQLKVKSHDVAHQWEKFLKSLGFKTEHKH